MFLWPKVCKQGFLASFLHLILWVGPSNIKLPMCLFGSRKSERVTLFGVFFWVVALCEHGSEMQLHLVNAQGFFGFHLISIFFLFICITISEEVGFYTFLVEEYSSIFASKWSMVATACSQAEEWRRSVAHDHKYADLADTSLVTRVSCIPLGSIWTSDMSDWVKGWRGWKKVTLPETNSSPMKIPIFPGKYHSKWWIFQPAILVYRRVDTRLMQFTVLDSMGVSKNNATPKSSIKK